MLGTSILLFDRYVCSVPEKTEKKQETMPRCSDPKNTRLRFPTTRSIESIDLISGHGQYDELSSGLSTPVDSILSGYYSNTTHALISTNMSGALINRSVVFHHSLRVLIDTGIR